MKLSDLRRSISEETLPTQFVGGVFPRKHLSILSSAPGIGKTWFLLKLSLDLCNGGAIFTSLTDHEPQRKVLFMCGETGLEMLIERSKLLEAEINADNLSLYSMADFARHDIDITLDNPEGMKNFRNIVKGEKPDIVIIDTLISFRNDDENASKETSRLLRKLIGIATDFDCAILISHHVRKQKQQEDNKARSQDDIIGSSAIIRLCGTAFIMERKNNNTYIHLRCVKSWWEKPQDIFWRLRSNTKTGLLSIEVAELDDTTTASQRCRAYVSRMPEGEAVNPEMLKTACSCSYDTAYSVLMEEAKTGRLSKQKLSGNKTIFVRIDRGNSSEVVSNSK